MLLIPVNTRFLGMKLKSQRYGQLKVEISFTALILFLYGNNTPDKTLMVTISQTQDP